MQIPASQRTLNDGSVATLRTASPGDASRLNQFRKTLHAQSAHLNATAREATSSWLRTRSAISHAQMDSHTLNLLAVQGRDIMGELHMRSLNFVRLRHDVRLAIGVLPQYQRLGVGTALLDRSITWARGTAGIDRISLSVHAGNHGALELYRRFGFVEEGRRKGAVLANPSSTSGQGGEDRIDEVLMALYLEP